MDVHRYTEAAPWRHRDASPPEVSKFSESEGGHWLVEGGEALAAARRAAGGPARCGWSGCVNPAHCRATAAARR